MKIYLTDTSGDRGQSYLLFEQVTFNHLISFAYYQKQEKSFAKIWHKIDEMRLYFTHSGSDKLPNGDSIRTLLPPNNLMSYAHNSSSNEGLWAQLWSQKIPNVIVDSGAFTAYTTGKIINPKDYARWALDFKKRWEHKMASLHFMNLDVIGDQDASWKNQKVLEAMGLNPIPIVTFGADKSHLIRAIENYDYAALGGLVPYVFQPKKLDTWLGYCFSIIVSHYQKTGIMPKIHLLGITTEQYLLKYPCYSSDSSSWVQCLRFGRANNAGIKKIPSYTVSDSAKAATVHALKKNIQALQTIEEKATKLWKNRGIVWDE